MVRWGGPRFEFYHKHQFLNHEQAIKKEEAQQVAFIRSWREHQNAKEEARILEKKREEQRHQEEQRRISAEVEEAARRAAAEAASQNTAHARRVRRLKEFATPVIRGSEAHAAGTYGCVMYPTSKGVPLPAGRGGDKYTPGVDRHRIVPPPPEPGAHKPWEGSGVAWVPDPNNGWQKNYYFGGPKRGPSEVEERDRRIEEIEKHHAGRRAMESGSTGAEQKSLANMQSELPSYGFANQRDHTSGDEDNESEKELSIFSHGSSNAPIAALGTRHMENISTKEDVRDFLRRYPTGVVTQKPRSMVTTNFDKFTPVEVTEALIKMQRNKYNTNHVE
uniref:Uncharacterized protein TCIL3000_8_6070 n=1 Tax=Trypanosoma congolense (strain IL3000) TaxID=1068625 RepID=G0USL7_TRYCI|nr:unnamed protein product [Trypanosoma congolense IL3000]